MPSPVRSPAALHTLLHEKLDSLLADCDQVMDTAGYGQTLHDLDDFLLLDGKKFLGEVFQQKLQERTELAEQKAENQQCPHCKKKRIPKTKRRKR